MDVLEPDVTEGPSPKSKARRQRFFRPEGRPGPSRWRRVTPFGVFLVAFVLMAGAATAAGFAQFVPMGSRVTPWISMGLSGGAVMCTIAAVVMGRRG
jgi:hypothetical protein